MARAVKDFVEEKIKKGVCGVTACPDSSARPKPLRWTIGSR
jgi:hypothetical protein